MVNKHMCLSRVAVREHALTRYACAYLFDHAYPLCVAMPLPFCRAGAGGDAIFWFIVSSEDTMSLKMCGLLLVNGTTHGLMGRIKNRKASCAY